MSAIELIGETLAWLANSSGAPGAPAPGTGPAAGPALGGGGGPTGPGTAGGPGRRGGPDRHGAGGGGPGGGGGPAGGPAPGDGPPSKRKEAPTLGELFDTGIDAVKELAGIADEVADIATKDERTADEEIAWGAGGTDPEDVVLDNVPGADKAREVESYVKAGYEGHKNVRDYIKRTHDTIDYYDQRAKGSGGSGDDE